MREQPFLPAGEEHDLELQALGGVQRHHRHLLAVARLLGVHDQADVLEEAFEGVELVHEAHELFQVLQPRLRLRALVRLPHRRVAGFVQDQLGELGVLHVADVAAPALEAGDEVGQRLARLAWQLLGLDDQLRRLIHRDRARPPSSCTRFTDVSPSPRLGTLMMRSNFRSLAGLAAISR